MLEKYSQLTHTLLNETRELNEFGFNSAVRIEQLLSKLKAKRAIEQSES